MTNQERAEKVHEAHKMYQEVLDDLSENEDEYKHKYSTMDSVGAWIGLVALGFELDAAKESGDQARIDRTIEGAALGLAVATR